MFSKVSVTVPENDSESLRMLGWGGAGVCGKVASEGWETERWLCEIVLAIFVLIQIADLDCFSRFARKQTHTHTLLVLSNTHTHKHKITVWRSRLSRTSATNQWQIKKSLIHFRVRVRRERERRRRDVVAERGKKRWKKKETAWGKKKLREKQGGKCG